MVRFSVMLSNEQRVSAYKFARMQVTLRRTLYICRGLKSWLVREGFTDDTLTDKEIAYTIKHTFPELSKQKPFFKKWTKPWYPLDILGYHKRLRVLDTCIYNTLNPKP